jgi:nicotinate-nucleotide adenylyltransferase
VGRRRIGILGGTFNPPHRGHLALARSARAELDLERVLVMPANIAPNKSAEREDPGSEHRLAMCRLAVTADAPRIEASPLEVERGGVSYTVDTLRAIHEREGDVELALIVGADTARTLAGWREPVQLLELAELAVAQRDGLASEDVREALLRLHPGSRLRFLTMDETPVSSSGVRERVARGQPVSELVGRPVAAYIAEHGLYRSLATPACEGGTPASMGESAL